MLDFIELYSGIELLIVMLAYVLAIVIALTCHEFSHAIVSYKMGDLTAKSQGRVSLNPLHHIDPIGFVCLLLFGFGWAKPVPVNDLKFKNYRRGIFLTSISGVVTNFLLVFLFSGVYTLLLPKLMAHASNYLAVFAYNFLVYSMSINLGLAIFNILPIPPLDGFNVITAFTRYDNKFINFMRRYSFIFFLIIVITPIFEYLFAWLSGIIYPAFIEFWGFVF